MRKMTDGAKIFVFLFFAFSVGSALETEDQFNDVISMNRKKHDGAPCELCKSFVKQLQGFIIDMTLPSGVKKICMSATHNKTSICNMVSKTTEKLVKTFFNKDARFICSLIGFCRAHPSRYGIDSGTVCKLCKRLKSLFKRGLLSQTVDLIHSRFVLHVCRIRKCDSRSRLKFNRFRTIIDRFRKLINQVFNKFHICEDKFMEKCQNGTHEDRCIAVAPAKSAMASDEEEDTDPTYIETIAGEFEGDIIRDASDGMMSMVQDAMLWPNGVVYYQIDEEFTGDFKNRIRQAMNVIEGVSCIRFKQRTNETGFVFYGLVPNGFGCSSQLGYSKEKQYINLEDWCFKRIGTLIHETLHTLGFYHEQARPDRDSYVTIMWENIIPGMEHNFQLRADSRTLDTLYDYCSIMHYRGIAFSTNGFPTIVAKDNPNRQLGQRKGMTKLDILKLNKLYQCNTLKN